jgi:DNA-directed RNA polymerase specialized sigma24 family protein
MAEGSVTLWLRRLRDKDPEAPRRLWERYYVQVVRLARLRLRGVTTAAADEEDVAAAAFQSFFRAIGGAGFERLDHRTDLWQILVTLTCRKAIDCRRAATALRRGGARRTMGDCEAVLGELAGREPDPHFAATVAEDLDALIARIPDDELELRRLAVMKLEGHSNEEIGTVCGCSLRTVERRLCLIRKLWQTNTPPPPVTST